LKNNTKKSELKNQTSVVIGKDNKKNAEYVVLKAAGYPFDFEMMDNTLEITDKSLFEQYARDQWLGMEINNESYLFDQKIIPDFAFKVISVEPENSIISENPYTTLKIDKNDLFVSTPQKIIDSKITTKYQIWLDTSSHLWKKSDIGPLFNSWVFQKDWNGKEYSIEDDIYFEK